MFGRTKGNPGSGNIKAYTPANAEKVLREMIEKGTEFLSPEEVQEALTRLGGSVEEGIAKMSENIGAVSKAVPSWAPDRSDMPVIDKKDLPTTSQALNKGIVNWNNPLKVQERQAMTRLAATLPKGSSERRTLLAMLKAASMFPDGVLDDEALDELTPEQRRAWKGYKVSMSYEVWHQADYAHGDTDDKGWEIQDEHEDTLEDVTHTLSGQSWLHWSSSGTVGRYDWLISQPEEDFRTGSNTYYNAFVTRKDGQRLSKAELDYLNKKLYLR